MASLKPWSLLLGEGASVHPIKSRLLEQAVMYPLPSVVGVLLEKGVQKREDGGEAALDIAVNEEPLPGLLTTQQWLPERNQKRSRRGDDDYVQY